MTAEPTNRSTEVFTKTTASSSFWLSSISCLVKSEEFEKIDPSSGSWGSDFSCWVKSEKGRAFASDDWNKRVSCFVSDCCCNANNGVSCLLLSEKLVRVCAGVVKAKDEPNKTKRLARSCDNLDIIISLNFEGSKSVVNVKCDGRREKMRLSCRHCVKA